MYVVPFKFVGCYLIFGIFWPSMFNFQATEAAEGVIYVTFHEYNNPTGKASNGHCCDGRSIWCQKDGCDYIFKICLDAGDGANSTTECRFGYKESKRIKNKDNVIFGSHISDLNNPISFPVSGEPPQALVLKIDVYDKDLPYTDNDFVDFLRVTILVSAGIQPFHAYGTRRTDRTSLLGQVEAYCTSGCENLGQPESTTRKPEPTSTSSTGVTYVDRPNADCDNLALNGYRYQDGVYQLRVAYFEPFQAYCDMSVEGWTVIQRRNDGSENFFRGRQDYISGFGDIGALTEYWLGLEKIYWLTNQRTYKLRITMQKADGTFVFAEYDNFRIDVDYVLYVDGYSGNAGDALNYPGYGGMRMHNGMPFSTYDDDRDTWESNNCGQVYQSGWWFNDCYWANLNGRYIHDTNGWPFCRDGKCIAWRTIEGYEDFSLVKTEMEILPNGKYVTADVPHG